MWVSMDNFNIRTTLNHKGIGTSFNHFDGSTYFVSTIESPFVSNEFETIIKISHKTLSKIISSLIIQGMLLSIILQLREWQFPMKSHNGVKK